jgi:hypothetical protein
VSTPTPPPDWVKKATTPLPHEVAALTSPLDPALAKAAALATEPLPHEVLALRRKPAPARIPWAAPLLVGVVAVAAALAMWVSPARIVPLVPGEAVTLDGTRILGPGVSARGMGQLDVVQVSPTVTEVTVVDGAYAFEAQSRLVLHIGPATISAAEGALDVVVLADAIDVNVTRGTASVAVGERTWTLATGDHWAWPEQIAVTPAPEPVPEPVPAPLPLPEVATHPSPRPAPVPVPASPAVSAPIAEAMRKDPAAAAEFVAILDGIDAHAAPDDVLGQIDAFVAGGHDATLTDEAFRLGATLAKDGLHDCERALPYYRAVVDRHGPIDASAWRGLCAASTGRTDEARAALHAALDGGVKPPLRTTVEHALATLGEN